MHGDNGIVEGMPEMVFSQSNVDISFAPRFLILLQLLGHVVEMTSEVPDNIALPGENNL
jgi:hypothetical protein